MQNEKFIKIGRIGEMEIKIDLEVQKVENGFILFKDICGIKREAVKFENRREVYLAFPDVRARMVELLRKIANDLTERIPEKT